MHFLQEVSPLKRYRVFLRGWNNFRKNPKEGMGQVPLKGKNFKGTGTFPGKGRLNKPQQVFAVAFLIPGSSYSQFQGSIVDGFGGDEILNGGAYGFEEEDFLRGFSSF